VLADFGISHAEQPLQPGGLLARDVRAEDRVDRKIDGRRIPGLDTSSEPKRARIDDDSAELAARIITTWCSPIGLVMAGIFLFVWARSRRRARPREQQPTIG
jgi:hypothetical protein